MADKGKEFWDVFTVVNVSTDCTPRSRDEQVLVRAESDWHCRARLIYCE